ncbi:hypothetical protein N2W54_007840 [Lotmaria passim]
MLRRSFHCRRSCAFAWYRGVTEHFSADTQKGMVRLAECIRTAEASEAEDREIMRRSASRLGVCVRSNAQTSFSESVVNFTSSTTPVGQEDTKATLMFSSKDVYLLPSIPVPSAKKTDMEKEDKKREGNSEGEQPAVSLHPCYIACGCPLLVFVQSTYRGTTRSSTALQLYAEPLNGGAAAAKENGSFYYSLPNTLFERWKWHAASFGSSTTRCKRFTPACSADQFPDIGVMDREVLEMIDLPLSRLISGDVQHRFAAADDDDDAGNNPGPYAAAGSLEDVEGIPM